MAPFTASVIAKKRYFIIYFILLWGSIIPPLLQFWLFWKIFNISELFFFALLPLELLLFYLTLVFSSIILAKMILIVVNLFHKPQEGVFKRDSKNKDYSYWSLRSMIIKWPAWISHSFPVPWHDVILMKLFGVKTNFSNSTFDGWVNCEFIEFGSNISVGQGAIILSSMIIGNYLIIKKVKIGDNVIIGSHSVISPGTIIGKNSILAAFSYTMVDQELEDDWVYIGIPAKKYKENQFTKTEKELKIKKKLGASDKWESFIEKRERITLKDEKIETD
jgi:acetyltransferase-like isoleucine patch superfamily enzyme